MREYCLVTCNKVWIRSNFIVNVGENPSANPDLRPIGTMSLPHCSIQAWNVGRHMDMSINPEMLNPSFHHAQFNFILRIGYFYFYLYFYLISGNQDVQSKSTVPSIVTQVVCFFFFLISKFFYYFKCFLLIYYLIRLIIQLISMRYAL